MDGLKAPPQRRPDRWTDFPEAMYAHRLGWVTSLLIVTALTGCDNVSWGGVDVGLQRPTPPPSATVPGATEEATGKPLAPLPTDPILYLARRDADGASVIPLALLSGDSLAPLPAEIEDGEYARRLQEERMGPGTRLTLFSQGSRVGSLILQEAAEADSAYCVPRPRVRGTLEIVPSAAPARTFLALGGDAASGFEHGEYTPHRSTYEQRVASINLAASLIPRVGAIWPPSILESRRDIQIFELRGSSEPAIGATFIYRDQLRVGPAPDPAYALFFVASHDGTAYRPAYVWYRDYAVDGKGAPRYLTHFDWNRDGSDEIVFEVLGEDTRWFAVAGAVGGDWQTLYQDACGTGGGSGSQE